MSGSDHFDGRRFFYPGAPGGPSLRDVFRMLREARAAWPRAISVARQPVSPREGAAAVITFIGHATFLIQTAAENFLTDPMYSDRASPVSWAGPRRVRPPGVAFEALPAIATVLLSHNHYDHCDRPTLGRLATRFDPLVVTPLGNERLVRSAGIRRVTELDWWQSTTSAGLPITLTPAQHFSARTPFDRNRALWGGFLIEVAGRRIYFAGDSAYAGCFADVGRRLGPIDLALLPIGAYAPRWFMGRVHMNPAEAVQAHRDLGAAQSIAMHYGTFQLTTEGVDEPVQALGEACDAQGVPREKFRCLGFGESLRLE
jgi:L-ascorbate metabolism protein UlaG (beta-lactamase superfamily)